MKPPTSTGALGPGQDCHRQPPGRVQPVIDPRRCEGEAHCIAVCPYGVFELTVLPVEARAEMGLLAKVKAWAHGWRTARVAHPAACHACGICVRRCPEQAISLRAPDAPPGERAHASHDLAAHSGDDARATK